MRERLSYANVMATIAVFVALGGSSYAAITITGANVRNASLTGKDLKNNSIKSADVKGLKRGDFARGQFPGPGPQGAAGPAGPIGPAGPQGDRGEAGPLVQPEGWRVPTLTGTGSNGFECTWSNYGNGFNTAAYYKDPWGTVHLRGLVKWTNGFTSPGTCTSGNPVFVLPAGYRPAANELHATIASNQIARFDILPNGEIRVDPSTANGYNNTSNWISLDGITFRAAG